VPGLADLKRDFAVPDPFAFRLDSVDAVTKDELTGLTGIAAFTMRKVQLLRFCASSESGHPTTTDVVVGLCAEILRALDQLIPGALDPPGTPQSDRAAAYSPVVAALMECIHVVSTLMPNHEIAILD
jgi:hypothetical protein